MKITCPGFTQKEQIPRKYTCDGEEINPPLVFSDVPAEAKSLALIMEDPDVPHSIRPDGMWDHWLVWNISPETERIEEGLPPNGVYGTNSSGGKAYEPPCPPNGTHRYFFKLFALDIILSLSEESSKSERLSEMKGHIIDEAELVGLYERKQK